MRVITIIVSCIAFPVQFIINILDCIMTGLTALCDYFESEFEEDEDSDE